MNCQVCGNIGVSMLDTCPSCQWENDLMLEDKDEHVHMVTYYLTEPQKVMWSSSNGSTPVNWRRGRCP